MNGDEGTSSPLWLWTWNKRSGAAVIVKPRKVTGERRKNISKNVSALGKFQPACPITLLPALKKQLCAINDNALSICYCILLLNNTQLCAYYNCITTKGKYFSKRESQMSHTEKRFFPESPVLDRKSKQLRNTATLECESRVQTNQIQSWLIRSSATHAHTRLQKRNPGKVMAKGVPNLEGNFRAVSKPILQRSSRYQIYAFSLRSKLNKNLMSTIVSKRNCQTLIKLSKHSPNLMKCCPMFES